MNDTVDTLKKQFTDAIPMARALMNMKGPNDFKKEYEAVITAAGKDSANPASILAGEEEVLAALSGAFNTGTNMANALRNSIDSTCQNSSTDFNNDEVKQKMPEMMVVGLNAYATDRVIADELKQHGTIRPQAREAIIAAQIEQIAPVIRDGLKPNNLTQDQEKNVMDHFTTTQKMLGNEAIDAKVKMFKENPDLVKTATILPEIGDLPVPEFNAVCKAITGKEPTEREL